jgi:hypothetical protein
MYTESGQTRRKRVHEMWYLGMVTEYKRMERLQEEGKEQNARYKTYVT